MQPNIQDIEGNYQLITDLVGQSSFVNWEAFTKSTAQLNNHIEQLHHQLNNLKEVQQRRFITKMKQLKSLDIPDLVKTVKAKKLPKEALKTILKHFTKTEESTLTLNVEPSELKQQSSQLSQEYISTNKILCVKMQEVQLLIQQKIKQSGVLQLKPTIQPIHILKYDFDTQKLQQIRKEIQIQQIPQTDHLISLQTYSHIVNHTYSIVQDSYREITFSYRQKQRQSIDQPQKYIEVLIEYLTNTQNLILEGQKAIVQYIGLTNEKVSESQNHMIDSGLSQSLLFLQTGIRSKIKESIQSTVSVDLPTTKAIILYQISMITERHSFFKSILAHLQKTPQNFQIIPVVIALSLNDFVHFKYQLEEEDFMKGIDDQLLLSNPQFADLFRQMEKKILFLMKDANVITEDMLKVMLYQSQQIQNQLSQIGLGKGLGGIFPGSSPQDILKEQQKAQLQKMKKEK